MATFVNKIKHTVKTGTNKVKAVFNPVTKEDIKRHNYILEKLENEQKLLVDRLQRNVYKNHVNLMIAQKAQNRSFYRIQDELALWDASLKRPKEKLIEEKRFREKAIEIQKQYENIVDDYAKEKGICTYLGDKDNCKAGLNCYWFGKDDVAGKDIGCYSRAEAPRDWSVQRRLGRRRKKPTSLDTIEELVGGRRKTRKKRGGNNEMLVVDNNIPDVFYIIQNNIQNVNNFQEQALSPDAEAEDIEGFNNLIDLLRLPALLREEGFWIVQHSLTRDIDDNYHHYHLSWDHEIPNINDNPDLVNAIQFVNIEQNGGRKRRKKTRKKTRKKRRRTRKKRRR